MVTTLGTGKKVVAIMTLDVGHRGFVFVAVIVLCGIGCIGAYLVLPTCSSYGISKPAPPTAAPSRAKAAAIFVLSVGGPAVPGIPTKAVLIGSGNVPVIPVIVNLFE